MTAGTESLDAAGVRTTTDNDDDHEKSTATVLPRSQPRHAPTTPKTESVSNPTGSGLGPRARLKPASKPPAKSISTLEAELAAVETQLTTTLARLADLQVHVDASPPAHSHSHSHADPQSWSREEQILNAQAIFARNIAQLRKYNDVKDAAMGMLALIAERQGKRVADVLEERGVLVGDD